MQSLVDAHEMPLLQTKFYIPPLRREQVPRPRLIERLNAGLHRKLTFISAPAGFGKTTLVSAWVSNLRFTNDDLRINGIANGQVVNRKSKIVNHVAWLSLDSSDNDAVRFLTYVIAALQTIDPEQGAAGHIGKGALGMLRSPQPPSTEPVLTSLLNEIATLSDRLILVLDDYHVIEAQTVHDALTFLLEHLPPQMHLVIATREDPPLPLSRLRARDQLADLRATDLRFTPAEATEFLNQVMGLDLATEDIALLETRTEGWIAGLQLAAISMQGHEETTRFIKTFTGSHHFILDYLVEEVLDRQSASVQAFLLQTAILDRLTGPLCDAVCTERVATDQDDGSTEFTAGGQATLELLEHANLFIVSLDEERRWYRYHHLFADLLRRRLQQSHPEWTPILHLRASEWYEQHGFIDPAIEHALRSEDFEKAADLIEGVSETVWGGGEHTKLRRWLDGLPIELLSSRPQLCIVHAWSLFAAGEQDVAARSLRAVEQTLDANTHCATATLSTATLSTEEEQLTLRGRIAVVRAFMAFFREDVPGIIRYARQALDYLPVQDVNWRTTAAIALGDAYSLSGQLEAATEAQHKALEESKAIGNIYMTLTAGLKLAVSLRLQGQLQQAVAMCRQLVQLAQESGIAQSAVSGCLMVMWAELLIELNDVNRASELVNKGIALTEHGGDVAMLGWSYLCQERILFSLGDLAGAEALIHKMARMDRVVNVPPWVTNRLAAWQGRIWLAQGKLQTVAQWIKERGLAINDAPNLQREREYMVLARLWIAQGKWEEATELLERLLQGAEANGRITVEIEILILQALALEIGDDMEQSMGTLERALTLAEPGGFIRIFVDEGPSVARLLHDALQRGIAADYVSRLLAAFPVAEPAQAVPSDPQSAMIEPLSERELEVLQLIAEGLTNPEIAAKLFLTLNTVKAHTRNIYGKLDVHSRTQAIARGQGLGLLLHK